MKKRGFSIIEIMVVVAIIALISGLAIVNMSNKRSVILRSDAEKIFQFLKGVQSVASKNSPVVVTNNNGLTFNLTQVLNNLQFTNQNFEIQVFRLYLIPQSINNNNFQRMPNVTLNEIDRNIRIQIVDNNGNQVNFNNNLNVFNNPQNNNNLQNINNPPDNPISLVTVINYRDNNNNLRRGFVAFRTNGNTALPQQVNEISINIFMNGIRTRHTIVIPNNSSRIELYAQN